MTACIYDFRSLDGQTAVMHLPPFHTFGICLQLLVPLSALYPICVYPPTSFDDPTKAPIIPTSHNIIEHSKRTNATMAVVVPIFLEMWSREPESVEWLKTLKFVVSTIPLTSLLSLLNIYQIFSGGPLSTKTGDSLVQAGVHIISLYGGTEFGPVSTIIGNAQERQLREPIDWSWTYFSDQVTVRWVPQGDGTSECQFIVGVLKFFD